MEIQTLSDLKILDLTWYIAGPYCTKMFADFGADVIKIERPPDGDPARKIGPFLGDGPHPEKSILFSHLNLNKRSITLDLKSKQGRETFFALLKHADILVENFSPRAMQKLGLDYEYLKKINPSLIMTSISNFGQTGPYRDFKASELVLSGIGHDMYSCGIPGRHPLKLGGDCLQYQAGHMAAVATFAAYWFKRSSNTGQYIDVSIQEVLAADTDHKTTNLVSFAYSGMTMTSNVVGRLNPMETASDITPSGIFPCKDGYVRAAGGIMFWDRFIKIFPELGEMFVFPDDVINIENKPVVDALWFDWCADRTKFEIMDICQKAKYFCMAVNTPKDTIESPQFKERGFWIEVEHPVTGKQIYPGDPVNMELSKWKVRMPAPLLGQHNEEILKEINISSKIEVISKEVINNKPGLPLEGIRVVDRGVIWAGPTAAWLMGILGAEVIHIDNPHHPPDFSRGFVMWPRESQLSSPAGRSNYPQGIVGERPWNRASFYMRALWNRLSCCIDISKPEGKEVFKKLIKKSDIFIENNSATAMENLGIGHEILMKENPRLICINMPAWGRSGPYKNYVGWGAMHQALGGEEWIRGYDDKDHPAHNTFRFHMDSAAAPMAVFAAITGLIHRAKTGKGQWVDFAQMQNLIHHFGEIYMDAAWNGKNRRTIGNRHQSAVQGCYPCRGPQSTLDTVIYGGERWVNITLNNEAELKAFYKVMGEPEWSKDEKFKTIKSCRQNHDEFDERVSRWTSTRDNFELFYVLQENGIPAGPVEDPRDSHMDPQLNARGFFKTIAGRDIGTYRYPGFPWKFSETPLKVTHPPCMVGEDNDYVYKNVIGLAENEIKELESKQVIGDLKYDWAGPMPEHLIKELLQ
jgi:crotonobetainyl-CoA:carnitine CoA-transferase CaiB-like acyl-CoA transferase